ncbi:MAG TPA: hypothetical protein ENN60_02100 [archaeon]|nr:hypothetical protein [archaeon]
MKVRGIKGSGLLIHILLLLIVYALSSSVFYSIMAFSQGIPQKMEIYASQAAYEIATAPVLTVPAKTSMLLIPCEDIRLPDREVLKLPDVLEAIHTGCTQQNALVCVISDQVRGDYFLACRGLLRQPDTTYFLEGGADGLTAGLGEGENRTVTINTKEV